MIMTIDNLNKKFGGNWFFDFVSSWHSDNNQSLINFGDNINYIHYKNNKKIGIIKKDKVRIGFKN